jgi:hypothetical protein
MKKYRIIPIIDRNNIQLFTIYLEFDGNMIIINDSRGDNLFCLHDRDEEDGKELYCFRYLDDNPYLDTDSENDSRLKIIGVDQLE